MKTALAALLALIVLSVGCQESQAGWKNRGWYLPAVSCTVKTVTIRKAGKVVAVQKIRVCN